jgi:hypothetical protein
MGCKCKSPELWKGPTLAVFSDLVTLDYYDGPTTAVSKCTACGSPRLLSVISWKPGLSPIRVFAVAEITSQQFSRIKDKLVARERLVAAGQSDLGSDYEESLSGLLRESPSPQAVLASTDLKKEIIAARKISEEGLVFENSVERVSGDDFSKWLSYLGIAEVER